MKKIVTLFWIQEVGAASTKEDRAYLRRQLRSWNRWPQKGWSVQPRRQKTQSDTKTATASPIYLNLNLSVCQLCKMQPMQEWKTKNSGEQEHDWQTNLWKAITELQQQSKQPQEPLRMILMVIRVPSSVGV